MAIPKHTYTTSTHNAPTPLLTPKKVATILGVSENTLSVWRSTNRYQLPWIKVGSRVMYDAAAVTEFIQARRRMGAPRTNCPNRP
jgi:predicted DNA-binding transcriptional regulator AlpA